MVHRNRFVVAVKVGGRILRETSNGVTIPFGSEYSILLRNLNSVRAVAKVSIDGQDVIDEGWLILPPDGSIDLERFIRNGNLEDGNRFKFIERTAQIEKHRGVGSDDGLIRVEFKFEIANQYVQNILPKGWPSYIPPRPANPKPRWPPSRGREMYGRPSASASAHRNRRSATQGSRPQFRSFDSAPESASGSLPVADCGITVPGGHSSQKFYYGSYFPTEDASDVIVIALRGEIGGKPVQNAVTVNHKPKCGSCGRVNKATASFCSACGTSLAVL